MIFCTAAVALSVDATGVRAGSLGEAAQNADNRHVEPAWLSEAVQLRIIKHLKAVDMRFEASKFILYFTSNAAPDVEQVDWHKRGFDDVRCAGELVGNSQTRCSEEAESLARETQA